MRLPNIASPSTPMISVPELKAELPRIRRSTAGVAARTSHHAKAARATTVTAIRAAMNGLWSHASRSPSSRRIWSDAKATAIRPMPTPSIRRKPCPRMYDGSTITEDPIARASMPMGTLTKKIHGQL